MCGRSDTVILLIQADTCQALHAGIGTLNPSGDAQHAQKGNIDIKEERWPILKENLPKTDTTQNTAHCPKDADPTWVGDQVILATKADIQTPQREMTEANVQAAALGHSTRTTIFEGYAAPFF